MFSTFTSKVKFLTKGRYDHYYIITDPTTSSCDENWIRAYRTFYVFVHKSFDPQSTIISPSRHYWLAHIITCLLLWLLLNTLESSAPFLLPFAVSDDSSTHAVSIEETCCFLETAASRGSSSVLMASVGHGRFSYLALSESALFIGYVLGNCPFRFAHERFEGD